MNSKKMSKEQNTIIVIALIMLNWLKNYILLFFKRKSTNSDKKLKKLRIKFYFFN